MELEKLILAFVSGIALIAMLLAWESILKTDGEIREIIRKHGTDDDTFLEEVKICDERKTRT